MKNTTSSSVSRRTVMDVLENLGWTLTKGETAVARKMFETSAGQKEALIYLENSKDHLLLTGDYQSEGRNILSGIYMRISRRGCILADGDDFTRNFVVDIESAIKESFAARLLDAGTLDAEKPDPYKSAWLQLKPLILARMTALATDLKGRTELTVSDPIVAGPDEEFGSDEYKIAVDLRNDQDLSVLVAEFCLRDGAEEGFDGFAVQCTLTGYNALVLGGYAPHAYTHEFYIADVPELISRVKGFDVEEFARYMIEDALRDETLIEELAEAPSP